MDRVIETMNDVKIIKTQYGRGVQANKSFKAGDLITVTECIVLKESQMPLKKSGSPLWSYVFSGIIPDIYLVALDWTSLMNHSEDPNVDYISTDNNKVEFRARKDINPGDELLINYGYDVIEHNKRFGVDTDELNRSTLMDANMSPSQGGIELTEIKSLLQGAPREVTDAFLSVEDYINRKNHVE